jgi:hypothetical protein
MGVMDAVDESEEVDTVRDEELDEDGGVSGGGWKAPGFPGCGIRLLSEKKSFGTETPNASGI